MKKDDFLLKLKEGLEFEFDLDLNTNLKELDDWDSMAAMVLIGIVNDEFSIILSPNDIENISTVDSLILRIGLDHFDL